MILYHGTNADFGDIDLTKSKPNKDFGQGFYLSREYTQAMNMAKTKVEQLETGVPTVLTYEADEAAMAQLKVLRFDDYSEEWAKFILLNRSIDLPTLVHNLRNMRGITFQYFFGTERAIKILKRL